MRRISRLLDALSSPPGLPALSVLLEGPVTQKELRDRLGDAEVPITPATLSDLMTRFEDLGIVERQNRKAPYTLRHRDALAGAILHLSALGAEMGAVAEDEAKELERLARKARLLGDSAEPKERDVDLGVDPRSGRRQ